MLSPRLAPLKSPYSVSSALGALAFLVLCAALMALYAQAAGMTWQFDDLANLRTLGAVSTQAGLIDFVFGGASGPLGRPLSLLTLVANYDDWTGNPWGVSRLNLLIHLLNGALVYLLCTRLLGRLYEGAKGPWLALVAAGTWVMLPIHTSSILMPVQRMTQVSAFFLLVTLYGFVVARARWAGSPSIAGALGLGAWVAVGTLLSVLGKENGAVTPSLAALIELFFFQRGGSSGPSRNLWRVWLWFALLAVPFALLHHFVTQWDGIQGRFVYYRGYSQAEHLATQWVISWEYVRQILLPRAALLGPYHDGHTVYGWTMWQPYVAILGWIGIAGVAWFFVRQGETSARRMPKVLLFAVLWFFASHQAESMGIPLELYFEHRNYVAALGFCVLLAVAIGQLTLSTDGKKVAVLAVVGFCGIQLTALQQITSLWGQPMLANEMWARYHPASTRATQALANDFLRLGFRDAALQLSDEFVRENQAIDVAIQFFPQHCAFSDREALRQRFDNLKQMVPHVRRPGGIPTGLASMGNAIREGKCEGVTTADYVDFLKSLLEQPAVRWSHQVRHHLNYEVALTQQADGQFDAYARYAQQAFFDFPSLSVAQSIAAQMFAHGKLDDAIRWVDTALAHAPSSMQRAAWEQQLSSLRDAMLGVRRYLNEGEAELMLPEDLTQ